MSDASRPDGFRTHAELLPAFYPGSHKIEPVCFHCKVDVGPIGFHELVYSFEECTCGEPDTFHLREWLWHRACFREESVVERERQQQWVEEHFLLVAPDKDGSGVEQGEAEC